MIAGDRSRRSLQDGVTLVELLVVIAITAILGTLTVTTILSAFTAQRSFAAVQENLDESRLAADRIRQEVRGARRILEDPTDGDRLQMWVDHDGDDSMQSSEVITYEFVEVDGEGRLHRTTGDAPTEPRVVARGLVLAPDEPIFSYDAPPPQTRVVEIRLEVAAGDEQLVEAAVVELQVRLRNVA